MATISSQEFFKSGGVRVVGNEQSVQEDESKNGATFFQRVGQDISQGFKQAKVDVNNPNSNRSALSKGVAAVSDIAGAVISPVSEAPGFKQVGELFSKGINLAGEQLAKLYSPEFKASLANMSPEQYQKATQTLQDLANAGNIANTILTAKGVAKTGELVKTGIEKTGAIITDAVPKIPLSPTDIFNSASKLKNDLQIAIAKKNVNPQLESSTNRLFLEGTKNAKDPIATYDGYLAQSKKALTDIKQDPAISVVGEKMGNAFETVVKQRQSVGRVLGDELNKKGKIKINVNEPKTALLSELKDSGLSYNPKTNSLTSFQGSKFAPEEVAMLDSFTKGVIALGDNPTVSQIDNFIAKTHSNLAFTKGKSGVIGTTNAERIINGGIAKLRATLDPAVNGNQALTKYWNANKTYSQLSDFVNEGSTFLGKKTLSGDFAKDASVAKSSVQSILNQGKKDFMIKLEALTGYSAIDDAVLALQAMKDAGDFRGLSLLQAMSDSGGIPTSKAGFAQKILDVAVNKGKEIIAGTPEEQTRAFLQDLLSKEKTTKPSTKSPTITPSVGKTTSSINQSNKSVISQKSTTIPKKVQGETTKQLEPIAQEAKKYKSADEFFNRMNPKLRDSLREQGIKGREQITKLWEDTTGLKSEKGYQMAHRPTETGDFASDITKSGESMPKDFYQHPEYYAQINAKGDYGVATRESLSVLKKIKGKPNTEITIYRASPSEKLNNGDWVTLSKKYAELSREGKETVHSFKVKAKDIQFAGDDINEFGYYPK